MIASTALADAVAALNAGFDIYDAIAARQQIATLDPVVREATIATYVKKSEERYAAGSKDADVAIEAARAKKSAEPPAVA